MNIFYIIFVSAIILLILILTVPIKLIYIYDSEYTPTYKFILQIFFFKIHLKQKKRKKEKKKFFNKNNQKENNINQKYYELKNKPIQDYYNLTKNIYDNISSIVKKSLYNIKIENIELYCSVTGNDASEIGIKYGKLNILVYNIYNILKNIFNIENSKVYMYPNFINNESKIHFLVKFKFKLIDISTIFIIKIIEYFYKKIKNKDGKENG